MTASARLSTDFDFLMGQWSVTHRALVSRLSGSSKWRTSRRSTAAVRSYLDGAASIDEISMPEQGWSGMSFRLYSPETQQWLIWWVSSLDGVFTAPVTGQFTDGVGRLLGDDVHEGTPIRVMYTWSGISLVTARWEQAFSADDGAAWETNWIMDFSRISEVPEPVDSDHLPKLTSDFDFLTGTWRARNRKLQSRLTGCTEWDEFEHTIDAVTNLNGGVSVDEHVFPHPTSYRGLTFRTYDVQRKEWVIHWIDSRFVQMDTTPLRGRFDAGLGEFLGEDLLAGKPILARIRWEIHSDEFVHWEQAFSPDDGATWEPNWTMALRRVA